MAEDGDYTLGTGDEEIERLGLQHVVWRLRALDAWQRARFSAGQTLLDVGCGPGHAAFDLAQVVGPAGRVIALDRSRSFLASLQVAARARGLGHVTAITADLDYDDFPSLAADGAWCRWVLSFVRRPRELLARIHSALRSGGTLVSHEYFDYGTWRVMPRCPEVEEFVQLVMESWRADGGEPDVALNLPAWLGELGFDVIFCRPIVDVVRPSDHIWQWTKTFLESGLRRLVQLNRLDAARATAIAAAFARCEATAHTRMVTPAVLEVIANKR